MDSIFSAKSYRKWIESRVDAAPDRRGYKARLAQAARCQRSYLSQVLAERAHLTPEHALRLGDFWRLSDIERKYWLHLVQKDRAGTAELKIFHQAAMDEIRDGAENLESRFRVGALGDPEQALYYSDPLYTQLHMSVTIPGLQTAEALCAHTGEQLSRIENALGTLEYLGLVRRSGKRWITTQKVLHVGRESPHVVMNHQAWRMKAALNSARRDPRAVHYTALYTMSKEDHEQLRQLILDFIDRTRKVVAPSPEERLACMLIDFWTL